MTGARRVHLAGRRVVLLPERAAFLVRSRTLTVADLHLGKAASFRRAGVPVPEGTTHRTLARLTSLLTRTAPRRLVILGDLLHARAGRVAAVIDAVAAWRRDQRIPITLVRGNHDRSAGDPPSSWAVDVVDEPFVLDGFAMRHRATDTRSVEGYELAGHIHPVVTLSGPGRERLRLPCFVIGAHRAVLPAFGEFTGGAAQRQASGDRLYVVADTEVLAI